jgi:hypothetical protein
MDFY